MLVIAGGGSSVPEGTGCQHEHRFRRKLGVTQGLLFCLLRASLPKRRCWKAFLGVSASCPVGITALRQFFSRARGW